jgi:tetratricopeptide (TPR) repeat protein
LSPIFRDRDELPASGNLGAHLTAALQESLFLLVLCSPASARSRWVGEEVLTFKRLYGEDRVLALIVSGRPGASATPGDEALECFPPGVRFRLTADGQISDELAHPIAADMRRDKDGQQLAKLKLVAGLTGLRLDDLVQRENQRRLRRLTGVAAASFAGMVVAGGLALYANQQRIEAERQRRLAEQETATARAASDYLIGTYKLINPATENPRTVTALTLLARGADRARVELAGQPVIHARILQALGEAYNNLGLSKEYSVVAQQSMPAIRQAGPEGAEALLELASAYQFQSRYDDAFRAVDQAEKALGPPKKADQSLMGDVAARRAFILYGNSELKRGLAASAAALSFYTRARNPSPTAIALALYFRGLLLSDDGDFAAAETALTRSLNISTRTSGERSRVAGQAWWALATNELAAGKLARAERSVSIALSIERAVLDADNPLVADALSMQGQIYQGEHKLDAAATALNEAIATYNRAYGRPHPQTGIALVYLALVESERGNLNAALADFDAAKHNYDVGYGKLHPNHGDLLVNRATVLAKFGRRREALADCAAGLKILDQTLGADAAFTKSDADMCRKI